VVEGIWVDSHSLLEVRDCSRVTLFCHQHLPKVVERISGVRIDLQGCLEFFCGGIQLPKLMQGSS
jgi:hypothetical protein